MASLNYDPATDTVGLTFANGRDSGRGRVSATDINHAVSTLWNVIRWKPAECYGIDNHEGIVKERKDAYASIYGRVHALMSKMVTEDSVDDGLKDHIRFIQTKLQGLGRPTPVEWLEKVIEHATTELVATLFGNLIVTLPDELVDELEQRCFAILYIQDLYSCYLNAEEPITNIWSNICEALGEMVQAALTIRRKINRQAMYDKKNDFHSFYTGLRALHQTHILVADIAGHALWNFLVATFGYSNLREVSINLYLSVAVLNINQCSDEADDAAMCCIGAMSLNNVASELNSKLYQYDHESINEETVSKIRLVLCNLESMS